MRKKRHKLSDPARAVGPIKYKKPTGKPEDRPLGKLRAVRELHKKAQGR
jgi:hypothetical protein